MSRETPEDMRPGWSERQFKKAMKSIRQWPKWMRPNLKVRAAVEAERTAAAKARKE